MARGYTLMWEKGKTKKYASDYGFGTKNEAKKYIQMAMKVNPQLKKEIKLRLKIRRI